MAMRTLAKQFRLPLDEGNLNDVYNNPDVVIIDERIFQTKDTGDVVVFLKYEVHNAPKEEFKLPAQKLNF